MKAAIEAASRMAEEQKKEANAMGAVARRKGTGSGGMVKGGAKKPNTNASGNKNKFNVFEKI